jgi:tRNA (adenine57-N1/adenine58-N1)-methyltransferase
MSSEAQAVPSVDGNTTPIAGAIQVDDRVVLFEPETGHSWLIHVEPGARKEKGLGIMDPGRLVGLAWGSEFEAAGKQLRAFQPDLPDLISTLRRKAAMILPKDAARLIHGLGVGPGSRVLESGIGTGASCVALAWAVGPTGSVVVQELREDFVEWASKNLERAGLGDRVTSHLGDLTEALAPGIGGPFSAVLLDQPEPWLAIPNCVPVLAPGARVACFCPQVSQMEQVVGAMDAAGFVDIKCLETIEREWLVKERGSRPDHNGLMHTAFLIFGRFVGPS